MALFGKRGAGAADDWTPVAIHIVQSVRPHNEDDGGGGLLGTLAGMVAESGEPYAFLLEIHPPDGHPYRLEHQEKVPKSVASPGLFSHDKIPGGVDVSGWVRVDDPLKVRIDWTSYKATPEAAAAVADASQAEADFGYAQHVLAKQNPKMQEQLRTAAWTSVWSLAPLVHSGAVSRDDWERDAQSSVRKTLITPEQYAAALAVANGGA